MRQHHLTPDLARGQRRIFFTLWVTYASFYLCRLNLPAALPAILDDLGCTKEEMSRVGGALFIAYAAGQVINGQLGDRFGARMLVPIGMFASAALNAAFGFASGLTGMMIIWGMNGYFQAMGWPLMVKTLANWFPPHKRGRVSGLFGSSYQCGNVFTWLLVGWLAQRFGWRWGFWIPCIILGCSAVHSLLCIRNSPEEAGLPGIEEDGRESTLEKTKGRMKNDVYLGFLFTFRQTVGNPRVLLAGLATFLVSMVSYGLLFWMPTCLKEAQGLTLTGAAGMSLLLPIAGTLGTATTGWAMDRFFEGRRVPVVVLEMAALGMLIVLFFVEPGLAFGSQTVMLCGLGAIGFMTFGPHGLIVSAVAMDLATRKAAASAAGLMDAMGYIGAAISVRLAGYLVERHPGGWGAAFALWAGSAFGAALMMGMLWRYRPERGSHL